MLHADLKDKKTYIYIYILYNFLDENRRLDSGSKINIFFFLSIIGCVWETGEMGRPNHSTEGENVSAAHLLVPSAASHTMAMICVVFFKNIF